jgi:drug/metabolite transporter (DMT)-like permease
MHYLLLILAVLFWSGNFIVGRGIHNDIPPISLAFWRWAVALLIILPFSLKYIIHQKDLIRQNWKILTLLAILSVTNFSIFIYMALGSSTVTNTVLINSMIPIFIVLVSWMGFKERITLRQTVGIVVSLTGLMFIIASGNLSTLIAVRFSKGDIWTISAGMSWALYSVLLRKCPIEFNSRGFLATTIIIGIFFIIPFYIWEISSGKTLNITKASIGSIIYVALFASVLAYMFWNKAIQIIGANKTGIFIHLMPVFSIILAIIFLDEKLRGYHVKGSILIFFGIFLTTTNKLWFQKTGGVKN